MPNTWRLNVAEPRTSRRVPTSERAASAWSTVAPAGGVLDPDVALVLGQHAVAFGMEVELRAAVALDHQPGEIAVAAGIAALGRGVGGELGNGRAEALAKDDVHDPLVGAIAIFERDFLGQDLDPLDRLGRDVAKLAEARDALAVEQQHRLFAAAAARASDLRARARRAIR